MSVAFVSDKEELVIRFPNFLRQEFLLRIEVMIPLVIQGFLIF